MKIITAVIQPHVLQRVVKSLHESPHYPGLTVSDCEGDSRGRSEGGHYVASMESVFLKPRKRIEIFCSDDACDGLVERIRLAAHTGHSGDGVIAVADIGRVIRIQSGQEQDNAV